MTTSLEAFLHASGESLIPFNNFVRRRNLKKVAIVDHICYKCSSRESFERIRAMFEGYSDYIHQSIISERRIAYIRLRGSIMTYLGRVNYLELSDQKPNGSQEDGFDHVEVYPNDTPYDALIDYLVAMGEKPEKKEREHHTTHDLDIGGGFIFRCSREPLIDKIKREEMI